MKIVALKYLNELNTRRIQMIYNIPKENQDINYEIGDKNFQISQLKLTVKFLEQQLRFVENLYSEMSKITQGE